MKIAVISDIHGNHLALQEVLKSAQQENAEKLLVLGDICGYYYHPDKVLELIDKWDYELIRGNHEKILAQIKDGSVQENKVREKYGSGHRVALERLSDVQVQRITQAPDSLSLNFQGFKILMCHGSPLDSDQYLYPDSAKDLLEKCDSSHADIVVVGHSHYPFIHRNKHSMLVNVGSVGQSRTTGGIASWLMVNTANNVLELKATPYNTEELELEIDLIDPHNPYLKEILKRNRV
ncbi:MAG TPA: metallophosphoesterase family protein [Cyclobacteriaceae bacterium]|jgi:putative phosphoesterase|nr:metallophosphoesterase family protein [Cyclobacteriaceae bacterium]